MPTISSHLVFDRQDLEALTNPEARAKTLESLSEGSRKILRHVHFSREEINAAFRLARAELNR